MVTRILLRGALLLCLSLCLTACETLRAALTKPQPSLDEAVCPHVPRILTDPLRVPAVCKKDGHTDDDYQACLEAIFGEPGKPETGLFGTCNIDRSDVRKRLDAE